MLPVPNAYSNGRSAHQASPKKYEEQKTTYENTVNQSNQIGNYLRAASQDGHASNIGRGPPSHHEEVPRVDGALSPAEDHYPRSSQAKKTTSAQDTRAAAPSTPSPYQNVYLHQANSTLHQRQDTDDDQAEPQMPNNTFRSALNYELSRHRPKI